MERFVMQNVRILRIVYSETLSKLAALPHKKGSHQSNPTVYRTGFLML